jgi:hypothetical protein
MKMYYELEIILFEIDTSRDAGTSRSLCKLNKKNMKKQRILKT